jgi:hypothetical protein
MFTKQFIGRTSLITIVALTLTALVAIPIQHQQIPSLIVLGLIFVMTAVMSSRSPINGLLIAFAEIMVGGHGHLIDASVGGFSLSIRMVIFVAVMLAWLISSIRTNNWPKFMVLRDTPWVLLLVAVVVGTVIGFLQNNAGQVFDDANSYITIAYLLPMLSIAWDSNKKRELLQVFFASTIFICVNTLLVVFLFTHLPGGVLRGVYEFVRDARIAEVTLLTGPSWFVNNFLSNASSWYFRVFEPAHFFPLVMIFALVAAKFTVWKSEKMPLAARATFVLCVATFIASLSRSFMIGAFVGAIITMLFVWLEAKKTVSKHLLNSVRVGVLIVIGAVLFWAVIVSPIPKHPNLKEAAFYKSTQADDRNLAVSSRWNLLYPMYQEIVASPMLGRGFGHDVTFITDDPRIRALNQTGEYTTYRFEWGYQDIWLKMGLLGLIAFVWYMVVVSRAFYYTYQTHGNRWLVIGLYAGLVALFVTHIFSPYLNHPIGLGYMIFVLPFFDWEGLTASMIKQEGEKVPLRLPKLAQTVTTRGQKI